ncbi:MAG: hypothetical protein E6Q44_07300 [Flavobacteriales bacterium]|nr:MAG: hypothetical protein E6Q44_07300 [Flavobacteriales bacterium]
MAQYIGGEVRSKNTVTHSPTYMAHSTLRKNDDRRAKRMKISEQEIGPRAASIQRILGYSKALKVVDAPPIGQILLLLN